MAKNRNPQKLMEEAKNIMIEARKKQAALIQEAKEIEERKLAELGKKCIEFLNNEISINELKNEAIKRELFEEKLRQSVEKNDKEEIADV